jgi:hypothetical protein
MSEHEQQKAGCDEFAATEEKLNEMLAHLKSEELYARAKVQGMEDWLLTEGGELIRELLKGHYELAQKKAAANLADSNG